jgi:RNA polymerase sigma-70 factor (ECF subfamily)
MTPPDISQAALDLEQYRPQLVRFAMVQLRDPSAAEDVAQDALLAALQGADRFAGQSSVKTWLIGILKHKIIDYIRRRSREQPLELSAAESGRDDLDAYFEDNGHFLDPPTEWNNPDAALEQRRFFDTLEACLQALPQATARVFVMREVMGVDTAEICKELAISPSNCWVMLYRARMSLRACLEKNWFATAN